MPIANDIPSIISAYEAKNAYLKENHKLFTALEGNLGELVRKSLEKTLSPNTYAVACERIAPINILRKVVDKLSVIYQQNPFRQVKDGSLSESDLLQWYEKSMSINMVMNTANEYFNTSKVCAVMPFVHKGKPRLRSLQPGKFMVYSNDLVDPTHVTHFIAIETGRDSAGQPTVVFHCYTDDEYLIFNSKGEIDTQKMFALGNPDGLNPYRKIPAVYVNRSTSVLMPDVDGDMLRMTMLVPLFLTDLNVGAMFTVWPILWTKDVNIKEFGYSPMTTMQLFTDPVTGAKPEVGTIEPKMDIPNQLMLLQSQLSVWLSTKNIRPAAVGELTVDNFASGVSKMIDEGDTLDERKRQVDVFKKAEGELWDLLLNYMIPVWSASGQLENRALFPLGSEIVTEFPPQTSIMTRGSLVRDLRDEVDAKFMSRKAAIKRLNPTLSEEDILALMAEIDTEAQSNVEVTVSAPAAQMLDEDSDDNDERDVEDDTGEENR
jgi:hypothetical protein